MLSGCVEIRCLVSVLDAHFHGLMILMNILGMYEFVKKGDPPVMGITKLGNGVTAEDLLRPRRKLTAPPLDVAASLPETTAPVL